MGENEALYWPLSEKLKISLFPASVPNPMTLISRLFTSLGSGWWKYYRVLCYCASSPNAKFSDFQLTAWKWTWWQYLHHRGRWTQKHRGETQIWGGGKMVIEAEIWVKLLQAKETWSYQKLEEIRNRISTRISEGRTDLVTSSFWITDLQKGESKFLFL